MTELDRNRMYNVHNPHQTDREKILCVCSAGLLRSPTAAAILAAEYNKNTRAVGYESYALIKLDEYQLEWCNRIFVMDEEQKMTIRKRFPDYADKPIVVLDIPDKYDYMSPQLEHDLHITFNLTLGMQRYEYRPYPLYGFDDDPARYCDKPEK